MASVVSARIEWSEIGCDLSSARRPGIRQHEAYQLEMHAAFDVFFSEKRQEVKHGFDMISAASADGRSIHDGLSVIAQAMNKQLAFDSPEEFSRHLRSRKAIAF